MLLLSLGICLSGCSLRDAGEAIGIVKTDVDDENDDVYSSAENVSEEAHDVSEEYKKLIEGGDSLLESGTVVTFDCYKRAKDIDDEAEEAYIRLFDLYNETYTRENADAS